MRDPLAELPTPPAGLVFEGAVPPDALFFDTNCALHPKVVQAQAQGRLTLISSVVYAELASRRWNNKGLHIIDTNLLDRSFRVVPFDALAARCFFDLCRQIRFDMAPLRRNNEDEHSCRTRLRFDLLIFAAALRHRCVLVTDNTRDFEHFPYRTHWKSRAELFP